MKDTETKRAFITARAEGKSYSTIQKELGIAKSTCASWEKAFKEEIDTLKQDQLDELYTTYHMQREARIKTLGELLSGIDKAIEEKPLDEIPADKLLELRLKYGRELHSEYIEPSQAIETDNTLDGILEQYNEIYKKSFNGTSSPEEVKAQLAILDAKRDTIYKLASEHRKEEEDPLSFNFDEKYTSKVIRHGNGREM